MKLLAGNSRRAVRGVVGEGGVVEADRPGHQVVHHQVVHQLVDHQAAGQRVGRLETGLLRVEHRGRPVSNRWGILGHVHSRRQIRCCRGG